MRWVRPRSIRSHSLAVTMRGRRSVGMIRRRLVVVIDGEGDALVQEALLASLLAAAQFFQRQSRDTGIHGGIGQPDLAVAGEHLVIGFAQFVAGIRDIHARARNPSRSRHDIRPAEVLCVRENFMLHTRSLHAGRAFPQALLFISAREDAWCDQTTSRLPKSPGRRRSILCATPLSWLREPWLTCWKSTGFSKPY